MQANVGGVTAKKTERLLNLVICLLSTRQFLAKDQIRRSVPQYAECATDEAFDRMFERDKDELRDLGVPLETGANDAWFEDEVGYRIDRAAYTGPEIQFEPDELAVLGLASRVWQQASLAAPASRALLKLKADGIEPDASSIVGIEPRVRTSEPAFEPVYAAVRDRRPITFAYRTSGSGEPRTRHLEPWGIVSRHGRWYVVGHDRDRAATRVFRLSRIAGEVRPIGSPGEVTVPAGLDFRDEVAALVPPQQTRSAVVCARAGSGLALRRRATATREGAGPDGWDELTVPFADADVLAEEVTGFGPDVRVLEPAEVRDAVVRRLHGVLAANGAVPVGTVGP
jgi:proteasome accessory factor B